MCECSVPVLVYCWYCLLYLLLAITEGWGSGCEGEETLYSKYNFVITIILHCIIMQSFFLWTCSLTMFVSLDNRSVLQVSMYEPDMSSIHIPSSTSTLVSETKIWHHKWPYIVHYIIHPNVYLTITLLVSTCMYRSKKCIVLIEVSVSVNCMCFTKWLLY